MLPGVYPGLVPGDIKKIKKESYPLLIAFLPDYLLLRFLVIKFNMISKATFYIAT